MPRLYEELKDENTFAEVYRFTHGFAAEKGFKNVEIPTAVALWGLMLGNRCNFLDKWCEFLQNEKKELQVVTKDTWNLFYDLVKQTQGDIAKFEDDGAWPSLIDEFIEHVNK